MSNSAFLVGGTPSKRGSVNMVSAADHEMPPSTLLENRIKSFPSVTHEEIQVLVDPDSKQFNLESDGKAVVPGKLVSTFDGAFDQKVLPLGECVARSVIPLLFDVSSGHTITQELSEKQWEFPLVNS